MTHKKTRITKPQSPGGNGKGWAPGSPSKKGLPQPWGQEVSEQGPGVSSSSALSGEVSSRAGQRVWQVGGRGREDRRKGSHPPGARLTGRSNSPDRTQPHAHRLHRALPSAEPYARSRGLRHSAEGKTGAPLQVGGGRESMLPTKVTQ